MRCPLRRLAGLSAWVPRRVAVGGKEAEENKEPIGPPRSSTQTKLYTIGAAEPRRLASWAIEGCLSSNDSAEDTTGEPSLGWITA